MFCKKCGSSLKDGALFCKRCGNKVGETLSVFEDVKLEATPVAEEVKPEAAPVAEEVKSEAAPMAEEVKPEAAPAAEHTAPEEIKPEAALVPEYVEPETPKPTAEPERVELKKPKNPNICTHCGSSLEGDVRFCIKCGYKIEKLCQNCGESLEGNLLFCGKCGAKVDKDSPTVSVPQSTIRWHDDEPRYGTPVPAAPKKQSKWQKAAPWQRAAAIVSMVVFGVWVVYIVSWSSSPSRSPGEPDVSLYSSYSQSSNEPSTSGYDDWNAGGSADNNTGGNNGDTVIGTGVSYTEPEPAQPQTFTSPKTGTTFTIPDEGYAEIVHKGSRKTVGAIYESHTPGVYTWDTEFGAYLDENSDKDLSFLLTSDGSWKTGDRLGFSELVVNGSKSVDIHIDVTMAYQGKNMNTLVASVYPKYFNDAALEIIEADSSGKNVKFWFYAEYKVTGSGEFYTIEGVGNAVCDAVPGGNSGGSTGGNTGGGLIPPGKTKCIVCNGGGLVNCGSCTDGYNICPNCNGNGTYYNYAQGRIVNCNRTGCRNGRIQCSKCSGTGKKKCGSCGGDGYR